MEVHFYGNGKVAKRCFEVLKTMNVTILPYNRSAECDLWISVHSPHIFTKQEIGTPKLGIVNVHNSYLPWNRGAHACTWAIIDRTPHGATMHWIDEGIDTGPIIYQERVEIREDDTTDALYKRTAEAEVRVFTVGMELLLAGNHRRIQQPAGGNLHYKKDFDRLVRAMTTSDCRVIREA